MLASPYFLQRERGPTDDFKKSTVPSGLVRVGWGGTSTVEITAGGRHLRLSSLRRIIAFDSQRSVVWRGIAR